MASLTKRGKVWYCRDRDETGRQVAIWCGPDKSVAQRIKRERESRRALIKSGVADPREQQWAAAEMKPISEHIALWSAYLLAKGSCTRHCEQSAQRASRLCESAEITRLSQINVGSIQSALADLKLFKGRRGKCGLSDGSIAHHAVAIKSFATWCRKTHRCRENQLEDLDMPEVREKFTRRALSPEELASLVATTRDQPCRANIDGPDRSIFYAVASGTGLRMNELLSLTPENFLLDCDPPIVFCSGANTKNVKRAEQPIIPELAEMLRGWLKAKAAGQPVFVLNRFRAAAVVRKDCEAAGIASDGVDVHTLRHSYITAVVLSGASVKVCQELARHADPNLTMNVYTHLQVHDLTAGLAGLVHTLVTPGVSTGLTGTDGTTTICSPEETQAVPSGHSQERFNPLPNLENAAKAIQPHSGSLFQENQRVPAGAHFPEETRPNRPSFQDSTVNDWKSRTESGSSRTNSTHSRINFSSLSRWT
jgi:site-specific recombinase XerD